MYFGHYGQLLCLWSTLSLQIYLANCYGISVYTPIYGQLVCNCCIYSVLTYNQPNTQLKNQPNTQFNKINKIYRQNFKTPKDYQTLTLTKLYMFQYK